VAHAADGAVDWVRRIACGRSDPAHQAAVREAIVDAAQRWLPREAGR
jgi:hypothetical protein